MPNDHGENTQPPIQPLTFAEIENHLWTLSQTDTKFLGHPDILQGRSWKEWESGKCMLVNDDQPHEPATFWLVGQISHIRFWLYADGGWSRQLEKPFTSHHATAFLVKPNAGRLSDLFENALACTRVEGFNQEPGVTIKDHLKRRPERINEDCFQLKHRVFEKSDVNPGSVDRPRQEAQGQQGLGYTVTWREMYEDWPLQNMPCRHRDSREALERLCNAEGCEHKWSLLEAYDEDELPLPPNEYEKLKGKTVFCSVSISRWEIERKYSFSLHIVQLQILKPPPLIRGTRSIPSRREDDILQSPTKRMRTRR